MLIGMEELELRLPSPLVEVRDRGFDAREVRLFLKRDDLIHPQHEAVLPGPYDVSLEERPDGGRRAAAAVG